MRVQKFLKTVFSVLAILLAFSCNQKKYSRIQVSLPISTKKGPLENENLKNWEYKDIETDTLPGISLEKAYATILKNKQPEKVIVAVLDSEVDINSGYFNGHIWTNANEIAENNIDDDGNGYIDDVNGWNFLGNTKGENITNANYEYVRIVRKYNNQFRDKKESEINQELLPAFLKYERAKIKLESEYTKVTRRVKFGEKILQDFLNAKEALKEYFPNGNYTYEKLKEIDTVGNGLSKHVLEIKSVLDYNDSEENMRRVLNDYGNDIKYRLNIKYNARGILQDSLDDISNKSYGSEMLFKKANNYTHGTRMTSVILSMVNNQANEIEVMPVVVEPHGDAHDKDIALGIRYAVDNGAKVINMSFGKEFSMYPEMVYEALKYAEEKKVLIISSSGNDGKELNDNFYKYPNDQTLDNQEDISDNFLKVGASTYSVNKNIKAYFSNYSSLYVDLFAPGYEIYSLFPNGERKKDSGTSISAALTSKVAALIYAYYPNLTASQVKHILMDSGLEYSFEVSTPTKEDKDKTTPFNQLSKSGRVLNAYNALIMADSISRK
ncbi:S8 family serine peptidase [Tenacibaculum caenipelagi]|uniref:Subtilase family protein n=1 Tax=Tenacibaculum caenipelagi TaxID=1325435 RepID=A0A4R6TEH9_9FLAO|nr:S8 family serine peptidase [Tenacibaculum caenipelagi]TDQ28587.1 subtilase family protein [Tenacibaculum caenipelagi]